MYRTHVVVPGVLTGAECDALRALEPSLAFCAGTVSLARVEHPETRRSQVAWLRRHQERFGWLFERIDRVLSGINAQHFDVDYAPQGCATLQYSIYSADEQAHYTVYMDDFLPATWPDARKLSVIVQLSAPDEYEGGTLRFRDVGNELPPWACERGTVMMFPSILYHAVEPITAGTRRSLVGWYSEPPWR